MTYSYCFRCKLGYTGSVLCPRCDSKGRVNPTRREVLAALNFIKPGNNKFPAWKRLTKCIPPEKQDN